MRRNATKVAAVVMSLAVTMTSVNLPTTAAAATKKVKLNKTKATLTVGKTTTLKVTKGGKAVKATFKSNKPKIAKVVKKSGKSTKIKALKKGTATITATYAKKKYKCKITVKAKKVVKPTTAPTVAPTVEPTVVPTTEPSTDAALSTKENAANVKLELTNAYNDKYLDTVLVGTNANIRATVTDKNGKPVANAPVVLASKEVVPSYASGTHKEPELDVNGNIKKDNSGNIIYKDVPNVYNAASIENLTDTVVKTDENGVAVFVFGFDKVKDGLDKKTAIDAMRTEYKSSHKLTATVAGSNVTSDTVVRFGAITIGTENVKNGSVAIDVANNRDLDLTNNIVPGENAEGTGVAQTTNADKKTVDYVYSQQVSKTGGKEHAVKFSTAAYLDLPSIENNTNSGSFVENYNYGVGKYDVYDKQSKRYVVKTSKASNLQYATVNFKDLKLSRYTKLTVKAYLCDTDAEDADLEKAVKIEETKEIGSNETDISLGNWSWQIPLNNITAEKYLHVVATIESCGQVNNDANDGFTVNTIEGVYKKDIITNGGGYELLDDVSVSWDIDKNVTYTDLADLKDDDVIADLNDNPVVKKVGETPSTYALEGYTYKYKVPAFPRTGNAIIYVYNDKKDVVAYYACTTKNDGQNCNVLDYDDLGTTDDKGNKNYKGSLYQLSEDEATKQVGDIVEQNKSSVTVNSEKTGTTNVVGKIESKNANIVIDASNNKVYSSVQWNPIPVFEGEAAKTSTPAVALVGQQMKVTAQLTDKNGNPATIANKNISFLIDGKDINADLLKDYGVTEVSRSNGGVTNAKGQVELVLSAEKITELAKLSAEDKSKKYSVAYKLGNKLINTDFVDLYWLDFDMLFGKTSYKPALDNWTYTSSNNTNVVVSGSAIDATVGSNWKYGVKLNGSVYAEYGRLKGHYLVEYTGVESIGSMKLGSKGTYTFGKNKLDITSKEAGSSYAMFKLNKNSFADNLTFVFKNAKGEDPIEGYYAGVGETSINKTLTLDIQWKALGANGSFVLPTGRYVTTGSALTAYYKLVDKFGNPIAGKDVAFAVDNGTVLTTVKTDEYGVAAYTVDANTSVVNKSYVVTATYDGVTVAQTYKVMAKDDFKVIAALYDEKTKKIVLRFSEDVVSNSVLAAMFKNNAGDNKNVQNAIKFYAKDSGDATTYNVADVEVNGTDVTFTLPVAFTESVANESYFKISFNPVKIDGVTYTVASDITGEKVAADYTVQVDLNGLR